MSQKLPFETVGDYLEAISTAKNKLLEVRDLGRKTADGLIDLIESVIDGSLPPTSSKTHPEQFLSVVKHPEHFREVRIVEFVNAYATSARLRNSIDMAYSTNKLPFETIGNF